MVTSYTPLVGPHLKYCVQFGTLHFKKDIQLLNHMKKRAMKLVKELESKGYEVKLREMELERGGEEA